METFDNISAYLAADNTILSGVKSSKPSNSIVSRKRSGRLSKNTQNKITLFIIDDDIMYLKALEHSIANKINSLSIYLFQTGEECLQQMKLKPAIIILDYYLNTKVADAQNGIAVLKQIRKISSKTKVIMLSGQDSLQVADDCMANGAYDYISKSDTSFVRINNLITNIVEDIKINTSYKTFRYAVLVVILILIAYGLIS